MNTVQESFVLASTIIFQEAVILRWRCHNIQQNDAQHNDTQYVGSVVMLSDVMLSDVN